MQEIIALSIVFITALYAVYSVVKTFMKKEKNSSACGDCACSAKKDIKRFLKKKNGINPHQLRLN